MKLFEPRIIRYDSLPSTNTEAARLAAEGAEEGLCIVADEQTAGRGRLQRSWVSPKCAGLYFSSLLRPQIPLDEWPLITFAGALAVSDALLASCDLQTDIKWPNDILSGERKICGILAEAMETRTGRSVIVGIGINLTKYAFPPELSGLAISVEEATNRGPDREAILIALIDALASWYAVLHQAGGSRNVIDEWTNRSSYGQGKYITVTNGDEVISGITRGVESDGALRVETDTGEVKIMRAGDVSSVRPA